MQGVKAWAWIASPEDRSNIILPARDFDRMEHSHETMLGIDPLAVNDTVTHTE